MGEAHRVYTDMRQRGRNLEEILEQFSKMYTKKRTIIEDKKEINDFKRQADEPIYMAMARATHLTDRIEPMYEPGGWRLLREQILRRILTEIISKKCKIHLEGEEVKLQKLGIDMQLETLIKMAEDYENLHDEIPKQTVTIKVNACTGTYKNNSAEPIVNEPRKRSNSRDKGSNTVSKDIKDLKHTVLKMAAAIYTDNTSHDKTKRGDYKRNSDDRGRRTERDNNRYKDSSKRQSTPGPKYSEKNKQPYESSRSRERYGANTSSSEEERRRSRERSLSLIHI